MTGKYRTRPRVVQAVQYDGGNLAAIRAITPPGAATVTQIYREPMLLVQAPGRPPRILHMGDWFSVDGTDVTLHSEQSFSRTYEPDPG